jgi:OOP family OmpA-OmpF porin
MLLLALVMVIPAVVATRAGAFEIITEEDMVEKTVTKTDFIKTADNVIVLLDTSESMFAKYRKGAERSKLEVSKDILKDGLGRIPDLGYNAGLYSFSPFTTHYPMGPLDRDKFAQALDTLPAEPTGSTYLPRALRELEPILQGLSGKTTVFLFNDGSYSEFAGMRDPGDITAELAKKYNVCFYVIGDSRQMLEQKRLKDMGKANECSRVVPFGQFVDNPQYNTGALYLVKTSSEVVTVSEMRAAGAAGDNMLFGFDSDMVSPEYHGELDKIGDYLQNNPNSYVILAGFTDSVGDDEYNMGLSRRRAENVAAYLQNNANVDADRIVVDWFGEQNPVADNGTSEGRALNRRVEAAVGFK